MTPKDIHHLASKLGVKWDSDPRFMARCEAWVGKGHLDDMSSAELRTVAQHLKDGVKEASRSIQPGDVVVMSPQYEENAGRVNKVFGVGSKAVQGDMTHSAIYVGGGAVIEARLGEGVTKKKLIDAVRNKSYTIMRPKVSRKYRQQAVDFAHAQVGKAYDTGTLVGTAAGLIASPRAAAFADKHIAAAADKFTCSNLITSAYEGTPLTKLKRLAAPVHLRYSTMLKPIKHHEEIPVQHVLPTAKVGEMPAPAVLKQLKTFGPPNEWSGAVASIAGVEGRKAMTLGWENMNGEERGTVQRAFVASFGKEAEDTRKSTTLKGLGTNTARGALAGMAGGALIAPMMGAPTQVLTGLGGHALSQAGQGAAAGAGLGMLFEAGKLQGLQEQIAEHQLQNPNMDIPTLGKLDTGIARGQQALLGANMGEAALRGTGAGALAGLGYGVAKGHGTPMERALLAAQTTGMGALKGSLAGVGLGAIRDMGVNAGRAGERSAFLEQQAKEAECNKEATPEFFAATNYPALRVMPARQHGSLAGNAEAKLPRLHQMSEEMGRRYGKKAPNLTHDIQAVLGAFPTASPETIVTTGKGRIGPIEVSGSHYAYPRELRHHGQGTGQVTKERIQWGDTRPEVLAHELGHQADFHEGGALASLVAAEHAGSNLPSEAAATRKALNIPAINQNPERVANLLAAYTTYLSKDTPEVVADTLSGEYQARVAAAARTQPRPNPMLEPKKRIVSGYENNPFKTDLYSHMTAQERGALHAHIDALGAQLSSVFGPEHAAIYKQQLRQKLENPGVRNLGEWVRRFEAPLLKRADGGVSPEKKKALLKVESFHAPKAKDWDAFLQDTGRKSFVQALKNDPRSDEKLKQHAEMMNRLQMGKPIASIKGVLGNYDIVRLRGGGLGCTCNDWRFKRSVSQVNARDCKHLRQFREEKGAKIAAFEFLEPLQHAYQYMEHSPALAMGMGAVKTNLATAFGKNIPIVKDVLAPHYKGLAQAGARMGVAGHGLPLWQYPLAALDHGGYQALTGGHGIGDTLKQMGHTALPSEADAHKLVSNIRQNAEFAPAEHRGLLTAGADKLQGLAPLLQPSVMGSTYTALGAPRALGHALGEIPALAKENLRVAPGQLLQNIKSTPAHVGRDVRAIGSGIQGLGQRAQSFLGLKRAPIPGGLAPRPHIGALPTPP